MGAILTLERRAAVEIRRDGRRLEGYAAIFNSETRVGDFTEVILPAAFSQSLSEGRDVLALFDHDPTKVLARTKSGTLRLAEDTRGLAFSLDVPDTSAGRDALALAERGDLGGASFGFRVPPEGERWTRNRRALLRVELVEVSIVSAHPAYEATSVHARSRVSPERQRMRLFLEVARWA